MVPLSLGVIGIRVPEGDGKRGYRRNNECDAQRHVIGSPMDVKVVVVASPPSKAPRCTSGVGEGRWVRAATCQNSSFCTGDPSWLSDACGFNHEMVWAPRSCRYHIFPPDPGPRTQCLARSGHLTLVGDSVIREYYQNCLLFRLKDAGLTCNFENIVLRGQYYTESYATSVASSSSSFSSSDAPVGGSPSSSSSSSSSPRTFLFLNN